MWIVIAAFVGVMGWWAWTLTGSVFTTAHTALAGFCILLDFVRAAWQQNRKEV